MAPSDELILLTGASGFMAGHLLDLLLTSGYRVRATVRSPRAADALRRDHPAPASQLSIATIPDMAAPGAFDAAVTGTTGIMHTASPFTWAATDMEAGYLRPAIEGTLSVLRAAAAHAPTCRRVVLTSSFSSMADFKDFPKQGHTYTEADWNPATYDEAKAADAVFAYSASKALAERAAWDFVAREQPAFDLATVLPPYIYGPLANRPASLSALPTSVGDIYRLMDGSCSSVPPPTFGVFVDVRDVALIHLRAYERPAAGGRRYFAVAGNCSYQWACDVIRRVAAEGVRERTPVGTPGEALPRGLPSVDNGRVRRELGIEFRGFEECVVDMARSLWSLEEELAGK